MTSQHMRLQACVIATELDDVLEVGCSDARMKPFILELCSSPFYPRPI